jgi:hypothetical protein
MSLEEMELEAVRLTIPAQDMHQWQASVNMVMEICQFP